MKYYHPILFGISFLLLGCMCLPTCSPDPDPQPDECAMGETECRFGDFFECDETCQDFQGGSGCHLEFRYVSPCGSDMGTKDMSNDASRDAANDVPQDAPTDIPPDVIPDVTSDVANDSADSD